jgi:hypothetical protein
MLVEKHLRGVNCSSPDVLYYPYWKKSCCQGATGVLHVPLNCKKVSCLQWKRPAWLEKGFLGPGFGMLASCSRHLRGLSEAAQADTGT